MTFRSILMCVTLCFCVGVASAQTPYNGLIQRGEAQLVAKDSAGALATGQQAIQLDANRWEAYALAGGALMSLKRYEEAEDQLSLAIQHAPETKQAGLRDLRKQCALAEAGGAAPAGPAPVVSQPQPVATTQAEIVLWKTIESSTNADDFNAYLKQYPNGTFIALARQHLDGLQAQAAELSKVNAQKLQQQAEQDTWVDPATKLMWSKKDNGADISQLQAIDYCKNLSLGGFNDWQLPDGRSLASIAQPGKSHSVYSSTPHVIGPLQLSEGVLWTADLKKGSTTKGYLVNFYFKVYVEKGVDDSHGLRALCMRKPTP